MFIQTDPMSFLSYVKFTWLMSGLETLEKICGYIDPEFISMIDLWILELNTRHSLTSAGTTTNQNNCKNNTTPSKERC